MKYAVTINIGDLEKEVVEPLRAEVKNQFARIGEEAVNEGRNNHGYTDRTGNLTSSMGFVVASEGNIVTKGGFSGTVVGTETGEQIGDTAAARDNQTRLVVVAGMEYASYVENGHTSKNGKYIQGRPVLANAELLVKKRVEELSDDLNRLTLGK